MKLDRTTLVRALFLGLIVGVGFFYLSRGGGDRVEESPSEALEQDTAKQEGSKEFGLNTDSFEVIRGELQPGEHLSDILLEHRTSWADIDRLAKAADTVFDPSDLRAGKEYTVFCSTDSTGKARCFVYQPNPLEYVVFDMRNGMTVTKKKKSLKHKEKRVSGVIHSSLYRTIQKQDISPLLALELSEVYAWSIDFYGIREGDRFRVVYDEKWVDGQPIGIGEIKAAEFIHRDSSYYAFRFEGDSTAEYFDENGKSLRKAFLKAPLKFSRISSHYSNSRYHPVLKEYRPHRGVDYAAPRGTPVRSVGDGRVIASGYSGGNGNYVKVRHNSVYTTMYLHLSRRSVRRGERVGQGENIGEVGSTGLSTGPHLDYRVYKNGSAVNPLNLDLPPAGSVQEEREADFKEVQRRRMEKLEGILFDGGDERPS